MNKLKITIIAICVTLLTSCALTDFAKNYLDNVVDSNQYEEAREVDAMICDPAVLSRLQKTWSKKWYEETVAECEKRKEQYIPVTG